MFTVYSAEFVVRTKGKGTHEITDKVAELVRASQVQTGLVNVFSSAIVHLHMGVGRN